jgi:hypothetical protein
MWFKKSTLKIISLLLIASLIPSCAGYKRIALSNKQLPPVNEYEFILHSANHEWLLINPVLKEDNLYTEKKLLDGKSIKIPETQLVHIYIDSTMAVSEPGKRTITYERKSCIPLSKIYKVEGYGIDKTKTVLKSSLWTLGIIVFVTGIVMYWISQHVISF